MKQRYETMERIIAKKQWFLVREYIEKNANDQYIENSHLFARKLFSLFPSCLMNCLNRDMDGSKRYDSDSACAL